MVGGESGAPDHICIYMPGLALQTLTLKGAIRKKKKIKRDPKNMKSIPLKGTKHAKNHTLKVRAHVFYNI